MNNPTSYTDEQVRDAFEWGDLSPHDIRDVARYLFDERKRLQAEVEALRGAGNRVTAAFRALGEAEFVREKFNARQECEASMLNLDNELSRALPNETKEAKS